MILTGFFDFCVHNFSFIDYAVWDSKRDKNLSVNIWVKIAEFHDAYANSVQYCAYVLDVCHADFVKGL